MLPLSIGQPLHQQLLAYEKYLTFKYTWYTSLSVVYLAPMLSVAKIQTPAEVSDLEEGIKRL